MICTKCGHSYGSHEWGDDNKGSFGDFCQVEGCDCRDPDYPPFPPEEPDDKWADGPYGDTP